MTIWQQLEERYQRLSAELMDPTLDSTARAHKQRELSYIQPLIEKHAELEKTQQELANVSQELTHITDQELIDLYKDEVHRLKERILTQEEELDALLAPVDEVDTRSAFLEIRAGTGGQEAALFVADLLRMYTNYALKQGWRVSVEGASSTDLGGYREVVMHIEGDNVYGTLKFESGVHRVQRVPATETQGRVHTSTATVAVFPEAEELDISINPTDLKIDVFRAGGAGGQHVNKTESAVRITHLPTGVVVTCQDERSQHKNKAKALKMLQSRLLAAHLEEQQAKMATERKLQVGSGKRAEKVRTYNFPQNRVTDHQVDITLKNLDMVILGALDDIIDALQKKAHEEQKAVFLAQFVK